MNLIKLNCRKIPEYDNEIRCFIIERNEALRLPYLLKHYKRMGVDRFFVVDNDSTDGTVDFLLSQEKVHVLKVKKKFSTALKVASIRDLLEIYGKERWCIVVDADEILVYPGAEGIPLKQICDFLSDNGYNALECLLLDMYSKLPLKEISYHAGEDPLLNCPYFDPLSNLYNRHVTFISADGENSSCLKLTYGGMRKRVFGISPCLTKFPLFKYSASICYGNKIPNWYGSHSIVGAQIANVSGALLHFKYLGDFEYRVEEEFKRKAHISRIGYYKSYYAKLRQNPLLNLYYSSSIKYKNSKQLVELGMMKGK